MASPLALFGFDAAEPTLVRRGIDEGWLPNMASLEEAGRYVTLSPMPSAFYNTAWAGTVTGTDVGDHQAVIDRHLESGSYRIVDVPAESIRRPPFWRYLSDAGVRSTVASIYSSMSLPSFRGTQVHGWGSIDPYWAKFGESSFDPPEVEELLRRAVGRRQSLWRVSTPRSSSEYRRYRDRMVRSVGEQTRGFVALVDETDWDFFFGSYSEPHQAGHLLWHLDDVRHPAHDPTASTDVRESLIAVYRAVDTGLGQVMGRLPEGCRVFVLTPHGMQPNYVEDPIESLLELGGWLVRRPSMSSTGLRRQAMRTAWTFGRRVTPTRLRVAAQSRLRRGNVKATMPLAHVDWQRTQAFALPSDLTSYVRINLAGREPEGIVAPGDEYDRLCDELCVALGAVTHAESGLPAAERVVRTDRLFSRPVEGPLPDICVIWADKQPVRRLSLAGHGTVEAPKNDPRTGQHSHLGFLLGAGPELSPSREEDTGNLLDVAPTVLALLGVDQPPELPGRPIRAFTEPVP
jgi:predicted AlkP superfamily phosphohydrolase/phosphomutase